MAWCPGVYKPLTFRTIGSVCVRSVFIYHMLYGSMLVCCHHVANKDRRLLPSAPVAVPVVRIHCTLLFAFIAPCCSHSLHPVARIHRALLFAFIAPTFKSLHPQTERESSIHCVLRLCCFVLLLQHVVYCYKMGCRHAVTRTWNEQSRCHGSTE